MSRDASCIMQIQLRDSAWPKALYEHNGNKQMETQAEACSVQPKWSGTMNPCSLNLSYVSHFRVSTRVTVGCPTLLRIIRGNIFIL